MSAAGRGPRLILDSVSRDFSDVPALDSVSLTLGPRELISVVGPSGCGKTTLLRLAAGLDVPTGGSVEVNTDARAAVFQEPALLEWRTALRNVELVDELRHLDRRSRRSRAEAALATVGLAEVPHLHPRQLSGGMRMRVAVARALVAEPELALFDEPFGALDEITRLQMQTELQRLFTQGEFAGLFITHSVSEAAYLSSRVLVMSPQPGRIVAEVEVPHPYPRPPELRYAPEFGELTGRISAALTAGHPGAPIEGAA